MRKLALIMFLATSMGLVLSHGASADGCNEEAALNEAVATAVVGGDTVTVRLWEDLTCLPAGDGLNGPTDQGHLTLSIGDDAVCTVDGIDMGNDPFGFGSSVTVSADAPCGAQVSWSGFTGVFLPSASGPGVTKTAPATGSIWWDGGSGSVNDPSGTFSKRANVG